MNRYRQASISIALALVYPTMPSNASDAPQIPKRAETRSFTAELTEVYPWCDHMPIMGPGERRQYLIATITLTNHTDQPLELAIARAAISFEEQSQGRVVKGFWVHGKDHDGMKQRTIVIPPHEQMVVDLRGDNLYNEGHHGEQLYLTLTLSTDDERVMVRYSGPVVATS